MAITPVSRTSGTNADITLPSHSAGDIILLWTYRSGGNLGTLPSDGSGGGTWTLVLEGASNSNAAKLQILVATGSGHTATGGTLIDGWEALVYSGVKLSGPYGGSVTNGANNPTVTFGGVTMTVSDGSSRIVSFLGTRNSSSDSSSPPSPLVRIGATTDPVDNTSTACFDTDGGVSSFSGGTMAQGVFTAYRSASVELIAADDGGGGTPVTVEIDAGSLTVTGQPHYLPLSFSLSAGTVSITGKSVTTITDASLAIDVGQLALTGHALSVRADDSVALGKGNVTVTGRDLAVLSGLVIQIDSGAVTINGKPLEVFAATIVAILCGHAAVNGKNVRLAAGALWREITKLLVRDIARDPSEFKL